MCCFSSGITKETSELQEERLERRRPSLPPATVEGDESSGDSADDYVQEKRVKKKKVRRHEDDVVRPARRKRKRRQPTAEKQKEDEDENLTPEQRQKRQLQEQIDAIVKPKKANRPKKRKKDADEEMLDRFADEEVSQLRDDMLRAAAEDDEANREKLPATSKLKLLPRVKEVLQKSSLTQSIMDNNLLEGVRRWLEPLPDRSLPALNIQTFFFEQLTKMDIDTNSLKESGLGRVVLFYTKCKRVTTPIARMANELVSAWSRPIIKRSSSYRDRLIPVAQLSEVAGVRNVPQPARLNAILARMREEDKSRLKKNAVQIPTAQLGTYSVAPRDSLSTQKSSASIVNDIERRRRAAERMRAIMRKGSSKN
ncbi:uncharacterized protein FOMMEDRAFT_131435 [Fomitiporia mediterranea MF3/22]|uniref:uncharacterized protein n=1 Tax=Fomitiporia mediterranea (strain MF3/22) TaxID=694068 RepID=UPI000440849C|nr:uncharacterized protein FOMMEDRAFT_131435 [Fomitiporia mediterranea MF3/22]EJD06509.1 hypothetical protein FOMMEDRAFT_131435 [Fomitiporia mediterranea MF3/22]